MKTSVLILISATLFTHAALAQEKPRVFGEFGLGAGQTLFMGDTPDLIESALGADFDPGVVANISMAFYFSPESWNGLGIGSRIKGSIAGPVSSDGDDFFFNYYNLAFSVKYYPGKTFNEGFYGRAGIGTGQLTTKRANDLENRYIHQFAVGSTVTGGLGYSLPVGKRSISLEAEFEYSSRSGTINGVGDRSFTSAQVGANLIYSF